MCIYIYIYIQDPRERDAAEELQEAGLPWGARSYTILYYYYAMLYYNI